MPFKSDEQRKAVFAILKRRISKGLRSFFQDVGKVFQRFVPGSRPRRRGRVSLRVGKPRKAPIVRGVKVPYPEKSRHLRGRR